MSRKRGFGLTVIIFPIFYYNGRIAQVVRAPALQAGGRRFESSFAHFFILRSGG